jgi:hypothetical protein
MTSVLTLVTRLKITSVPTLEPRNKAENLIFI